MSEVLFQLLSNTPTNLETDPIPPAVPAPDLTEANADDNCVHVPDLPREPTTNESGRWSEISERIAVVILPAMNSTTIDI